MAGPRTRILVLTAICLGFVACRLPFLGGGREAAPAAERYSVVIEGRVVGQMSTTAVGAYERETFFTYRDRERGPRLRMHFAPGADGVPVKVDITGEDADGNPVDEHFQRGPPESVWSSQVDQGRSERTFAFYVPASPIPEVLAHLARALLQAPAHTLPILPAGEARLESWGTSEFETDDGPLRLSQYAVYGLQFGPSLLWLDADGEFFASGAPFLSVIRRGQEALLPRLFSAQSQALASRERALVAELSERPATHVALTGARLFDPRTLTTREQMTVVLRGAWILEVGADGKVALPPGTKRIDAGGKMLLPGLWDMHVHPESMGGLLHLAAGVTTVRDCGSDVGESLGRRAQVARGEALGPRLLLAGLIDGPSSSAGPTQVLVSTPEQARAAVDRFAALGFDQVKVYNSIAPALVPVLAERAESRGLSLSGHVPGGMTAESAVRAGLDEVHHAYFLFPSLFAEALKDHPDPLQVLSREAPWFDLEGERFQQMVRLFRARGTVLDPTLALCEGMYLARPGQPSPALARVADRLPVQLRRTLSVGGTAAEGDLERRLRGYFQATVRLVGALHRAGVPVVAGSDALAGFTLQRELELLVDAGLSPAEVLRVATLGAAELMKRDRELGTIEPGKRADLILVDGDPAARISDVRRVTLVVKDGALHQPEALYRAIGVAP